MTSEQEQQVKKLKRFLEGWRMAVVPLKSVFLWEQQWHPAAIFGAVSVLYLFIWVLDLNFLTTVALLGLILNFVDFVVPVICNSIYGPNSWNGQKEKKFEDICKSVVINYNKTLTMFKSFYSLRENSPIMYYVISISALLTLAWLAASVNNIFLVYLTSTTLLLWPGVQQRGILDPLLSMINSKSVKAE